MKELLNVVKQYLYAEICIKCNISKWSPNNLNMLINAFYIAEVL